MERIKFDPSEIQVIGKYSPLWILFPPVNKYKSPITPKENFQLALNKQKPLWMPSYNDIQWFRPRIIPDNVACGIIADGENFVGPQGYGGKGWFDTEWEFIESAGGATVKPGNPQIKDINNWEEVIKFPDLEAIDWEGNAKRNKEFFEKDRILESCILCGLFERLISLMDVENALIAMVDEDEKEGVHRFFDALCEFYDKLFDKLKKYYNPDIILMHDDWGTQRSSFFSADTCNEMLVPYMKRIVESAHKRGILFELHSCGKNELLVPCMIECGVDLWTPQSMNDTKVLAEKYGEHIMFGVYTDLLDEKATDEEMRESAYNLVQKYKDLNVYVFPFMASDKLLEYIYEESRKEYYK